MWQCMWPSLSTELVISDETQQKTLYSGTECIKKNKKQNFTNKSTNVQWICGKKFIIAGDLLLFFA